MISNEMYQYLQELDRIRPELRGTQQPQELLQAIEFLEKYSIKRYVEIGSSGGFSMLAFGKLATDLRISIDLPGGLWGGVNGDRAVARHYMWQEYFSTAVHSILLDSHDPGTLTTLQSILQNTPIDLLFIDGDHSYEGVKKDFEMYAPLVMKGGYIMFHDIDRSITDPNVQVSRFWNEIKEHYPYVEFNQNEGWAGIGIIENVNFQQ